MTEQTIQWLAIGIVILGQAVLVALRIIEKKNGKRNSNNPGNHGERIMALETDMKNVKEDIKEIRDTLKKKR